MMNFAMIAFLGLLGISLVIVLATAVVALCVLGFLIIKDASGEVKLIHKICSVCVGILLIVLGMIIALLTIMGFSS